MNEAAQGEPNDEKDLLWDLLYRHTESTVVPAAAASRLPNRTVVVPGSEGDGIIALEVFHQLHCLNSLRKALYPHRFPDYRFMLPDGSRHDNNTLHHDHCIDRLRQGVMCASDLGALYFRWKEEQRRWKINMESTHTCRNFETIRQWAVDRNLAEWNESQPSRLTP